MSSAISFVHEKTAGPLFCDGITVFNPIIHNNIKPTDHVAVVGIGGLGHMTIKFLNSWGCEVTAVSSNPEKERETQQFGAHHFLNSRDPHALSPIDPFDRFDMTDIIHMQYRTFMYYRNK